MKSSTRDQIEGAAKQVKGAAKETLGKATDRPDREIAGKVDQAEGRFQKKTGEIKRDFGR
jgi:uncharacterized protein YjbJ (UPF0337 family)